MSFSRVYMPSWAAKKGQKTKREEIRAGLGTTKKGDRRGAGGDPRGRGNAPAVLERSLHRLFETQREHCLCLGDYLRLDGVPPFFYRSQSCPYFFRFFSRFVFALSSLPSRAYTPAKMKPILQVCFCCMRTLRSSEVLISYLSASVTSLHRGSRFELRDGLVYSVVTAVPPFYRSQSCT